MVESGVFHQKLNTLHLALMFIFRYNSTHDYSGLSLLDFLSRIEDLQNDMDITLSMNSGNISKLDPHKAYRFDGNSAIVLKRYALESALCPKELIYCVHLSDFNVRVIF